VWTVAVWRFYWVVDETGFRDTGALDAKTGWTSRMRFTYLGWMMMRVDGCWMMAWRHCVSGVGYYLW
jgi:hypothetical protein